MSAPSWLYSTLVVGIAAPSWLYSTPVVDKQHPRGCVSTLMVVIGVLGSNSKMARPYSTAAPAKGIMCCLLNEVRLVLSGSLILLPSRMIGLSTFGWSWHGTRKFHGEFGPCKRQEMFVFLFRGGGEFSIALCLGRHLPKAIVKENLPVAFAHTHERCGPLPPWMQRILHH
jgi:hypothetical protein